MTSGRAWAGLAVGIAAYDGWACRRGHETLSCGFGRALARRRSRWAVVAVWAYLTAHLFGPWLPRAFARVDPLTIAARRLRP